MTDLQLLKKLCSIPSVSGAENTIADAIKALISPYTDTQETDALGNLICFKRSEKAKQTLLLCAHMDEIGYLVTGAHKTGYLTIAPLGGPEVLACAYLPVVFENGVRGAIVPKADTKAADLDLSKLIADIGAKSASDALRRAPVGTRLTAQTTLYQVTPKRVMGRALDDKSGVCALIRVAEALANEKNLPWNIQYLFSVQEEEGARGARAAAFTLAPDFTICVDVTPADDAATEQTDLPKLGGGCCIKYKDRSVLCDRRMIRHLEALADKHRVKTQPEILTDGGTDTGAIQSSRSGVIAGAISIPVRYCHTPSELIDLNDLENAVKLIAAFSQTPFEV